MLATDTRVRTTASAWCKGANRRVGVVTGVRATLWERWPAHKCAARTTSRTSMSVRCRTRPVPDRRPSTCDMQDRAVSVAGGERREVKRK